MINTKTEMSDKDYNGVEVELNNLNILSTTKRFRFTIPYAKENLLRGLKLSLKKDDVVWVDGYDEIADWLTDNKGKGLLLIGGCGLGKSLITTRIFPVMFKYYCEKGVSIYYPNIVNKHIDEILSLSMPVIIDDIGIEEEFNSFGNKRYAMREIVDDSERTGRLLILTTNLTVEELEIKYGERTVDRLRGMTRMVILEGESNRK